MIILPSCVYIPMFTNLKLYSVVLATLLLVLLAVLLSRIMHHSFIGQWKACFFITVHLCFVQLFSPILSYLTLLNYIDVQMIIAEA